MRRFILFSFFLAIASCLLFIGESYANNLSVNSVNCTQDSANHQMVIQFNISWENSWRDASNYDAAWVFIKYSLDGGANWNHATLKADKTLNPTGFLAGSATIEDASHNVTNHNLDFVVPADKKGAFVQLSSSDVAAGKLSATGVNFIWNYNGTGGNGVSDTNASFAVIDVMAIEMVYVPSGVFYLGDGVTTGIAGQFCSAKDCTTPFQITGESAITLGGGDSGSLGNHDKDDGNYGGMASKDDFNDDTPRTLPDEFPKGYNAFYIMKYELSQGQYRDFLNTLTRAQQAYRISVNISGTSVPNNYYFMDGNDTSGGTSLSPQFRNGIRCAASIPASPAPVTFFCDLNNNGIANQADDGEWIACNYVSWVDLAAYACWSGLRPMTEFEFEKACRGPSTSTPGEYAWGTAELTPVTGINNSGLINETGSYITGTGNGLCNSNNGDIGPLRSGFAATSNTTRITAGASYWGAMDLSGNNWERCVSVGSPSGRPFAGTHGTGSLSTNGNATNSDWPGYSIASSDVTGAAGSGFRGDNSTSIRYFATNLDPARGKERGIRCVRTAP